MSSAATAFVQSFFHGTRADLKPGDLIVVGQPSNFTDVKPLSWVYFTATLDAAIWARSWPQAPHQGAFTSWSRPDRSWTIRT